MLERRPGRLGELDISGGKCGEVGLARCSLSSPLNETQVALSHRSGECGAGHWSAADWELDAGHRGRPSRHLKNLEHEAPSKRRPPSNGDVHLEPGLIAPLPWSTRVRVMHSALFCCDPWVGYDVRLTRLQCRKGDRWRAPRCVCPASSSRAGADPRKLGLPLAEPTPISGVTAPRVLNSGRRPETGGVLETMVSTVYSMPKGLASSCVPRYRTHLEEPFGSLRQPDRGGSRQFYGPASRRVLSSALCAPSDRPGWHRRKSWDLYRLRPRGGAIRAARICEIVLGQTLGDGASPARPGRTRPVALGGGLLR